MKIKKLLAVGLAAVAGATLTAGAIFAQSSSLESYVQTADGSLTSPMIVVGDSVPGSDVIGAADIAAGVAGFATTPVTVSGAGTTSVTGGVDLATPARPLFVGSALNRGKDTLTDRDLPTELAAGTLTDDSGSTFDFDQFIDVGGRTVKFDDSSGDLVDPELIVDLGTSATSPYMTFRIDFTDPVELNATDSEGNNLDIFGTTFTIDPETTATSVVLQGGGARTTINERETATVTIDGVDHTVEVRIISSGTPDNALVVIDGITDDINEGVSKVIGGVSIFADTLAPSGSDNPGVAVLLVGSRKLTLTDGQAVLIGESDDVLDNTLVTFTKDGSNWEAIKIDVGAQDSNFDHLSAGDSITDPVFGIVKTAFSGINPALDDSSRNELIVGTAGDDEVTFRIKDFNGDTISDFPWAVDANPNSNGDTLTMQNDDGDNIIVVEGATINDDDFFITSVGDADRLDFSHLWEVTSIVSLGTSNAEIKIRDVFSNRNVNIQLGSDNSDQKAIDGKNFYFNVTNQTAKTFTVTWEDSANFNDPGDETTIFPILEGFNGEKIALTGAVSTPALGGNGTSVGDKFKLPTGTLNITALNTTANTITLQPINLAGTAGSTVSFTGGVESSISAGQVSYNITYVNATDTLTILPKVAAGQPAILVVEEENDDNEFHGLIITTGDNTDGATVDFGTTSTNGFTDGIGTLVTTDNSDIQQGVSEFGTLVEEDKTDDQGVVRVWYPDFQAVATVAVGADPVFSSQAGGQTVETAIKITNPIAKFANEVNADATLSSDLILVGGPCANSLVATLMSAENVTCDNWSFTTGLIKEYTGVFGSGQKALVVAGTTAADTRSLASQVIQGTLSFQA